MRCVLIFLLYLVVICVPSLNGADEAIPVAAIHIHDGFKVERIYSVPREQGSWVAMCFDDKGRIYASDQGPRLFRITPPKPGTSDECSVEVVSEKWGYSQGMAFINGALYIIQHGTRTEEDFRPDVLLRAKDTNNDDKLDSVETLIEFARVTGDAVNWVEHSYHAVVPGPDGRSIYIISGDRNGVPCQKGRTAKHWNRDSWDHTFEKEPYSGGWVMRADLDGNNQEYVCIGLRNCYDMAFNHRGDLFTYDSDLENDFGLPNYRPTAIRQILSGTDSGWGGRAGEMLWSWTPKWEDIQPPLQNIGPGSPTGVCFGYGAKFPARYQHALFACDWSYGRMFAVHLLPQGSSYTADPEPFLSAQGLPIADLAISPLDSALYFLIGGRGTQSGIYRVTYTGNESTEYASEPPLDPTVADAQRLRRRLEEFHGAPNPQALSEAWKWLGHSDRAIRGAARAALEWQPVNEWKQRALDEKDPRTQLQALLALVRSTDKDENIQQAIVNSLDRLNFSQLGFDEQCWYLRIVTISATRHGKYSEQVAAKLIGKVEPVLPSSDHRVNEEIIAMCAGLRSDTFIAPALDLLENSRTQEEQVLYTQALTSRRESVGWTTELRKRLFTLAVNRVPHWKGGATARAVRDRTFHVVIEMLSELQRKEFAELIDAARKPPTLLPTTTRPFVRKWILEDILPTLETGLAGNRDIKNGRKLFTAASCIVCHGFQGEGGLGGPDLTSAGRRYNSVDLLDNILNPSKVINEQYGLLIYNKKDGKSLIGRTVNMSGDTIMVATNPNDPGGSEVRFSIHDLESTTPSKVSLMPEGLLNTLTQEDIFDLLAYLQGR